MLAYLEVLCGALIARDQAAIELLRADPRASALPAAVQAEMREFLRQGRAARGAPLQTLHLYYQQMQIARSAFAVNRALPQGAPEDDAELVTTAATHAAAGDHQKLQMQLPLFAA